MEAILSKDRVHSEQTAISRSKGSRKVLFHSVDSVSINDGGEGVELIPGS